MTDIEVLKVIIKYWKKYLEDTTEERQTEMKHLLNKDGTTKDPETWYYKGSMADFINWISKNEMANK